MTTRMKLVFFTAALVAVLVFVTVVDFGISAGRIHHGITVHRVDIGGLTLEEAKDLLEDHTEELEDTPVLFKFEGETEVFEVLPTDVEWRPRIERTLDLAYNVGRKNGIGALADRFRAWVSGIKMPLKWSVDKEQLALIMDEWEEEGLEMGVDVARFELRRKLRASFLQWPREELVIPVKDDVAITGRNEELRKALRRAARTSS